MVEKVNGQNPGSFPLQTGMYQMVKDSNQKILLQSAEPQIK